MNTVLEGLPDGVVKVDGGASSVHLTVDTGLYPLEAVYSAAYVFLDRCYVFLDRTEDGKYRITLSTRELGADEGTLRAMVGEFANELLSCAWRHRITQQNRALIEQVTAQALAGAMGPPSLDDLEAFDFFTEESFEDPLGIAVSWEEKYQKKRKGTALDRASTEGNESLKAGDEPEVPKKEEL